MTLIAITIWPEFLKMWDTQDYFGVPGVFTAPWWPIKLTILFGTALCAMIFVLKAAGPPRRSATYTLLSTAHEPDRNRPASRSSRSSC